jgi:hypothetical protein
MLVYCDYLMNRIRNEFLVAASESGAVAPVTHVGKMEWDLDESGAFKSTTKRLNIVAGGKKYLITVEEVK